MSLLCRRLEGLPLAIELAAAWASTLTPEQILLRLARRFDLLVSRRVDVPERHRSLQAVLEGSYQLLPPKLQHLFRLLSVFRGGWTLEAAEQVAALEVYGEDGLVHYLTALAVLQERSFAQAEERGAEMRYRLLESLREFGVEQSPPEERTALARRHAEYFLTLAEEARERIRTPEETQWFDRVEAEHDNLRSALEWAVENDAEMALKMAALLGSFWMTRGFAVEGSQWLRRALAREGAMTLARAEALNALALMGPGAGRVRGREDPRARGTCRLARVGDEKATARALNTLGSILMEQGDYSGAQACYDECLSLYRAAGYKTGESIVLANLGNLVYGRGEYARACAYYEECLALRRALGDRRGIASVLDYYARVVREQGDYLRAGALHAESLAMRRELKDKLGVATALNRLSVIKTVIGEPEAARALLLESVVYWRKMGDRSGLAEALGQLGELARRDRDDRAARAYWSESLSIQRETGDRSSVPGLLEAFAELAASCARPDGAARLYGAAAAIREAISRPVRASGLGRYEQAVASVRNSLGAERFEAAWAEGRALSIEQAIALTKFAP